MKPFAIVYSDGVRITKEQGRLIIQTKEKKFSFPLKILKFVLILGKGVSITDEVLHECSKNSVPVCFASKRGKIKAIVFPQDYYSKGSLRYIQYQLFKEKRIEIAKKIVGEKIKRIEEITGNNLNSFKTLLDKAQTLSEIMGVEGVVSKHMFEVLSRKLEGTPFEFNGRNYRPPKDMVNALLSFSYTLVYNLSLSIVVCKGFDPYTSFLHTGRGSHASFVSDIMEPVRPLVTNLVFENLSSGNFSPNEGNIDGGYFILKQSAVEKISKIIVEHLPKILSVEEDMLRLIISEAEDLESCCV